MAAIKLAVTGACGRMGKRLIALSRADKSFDLIATIDRPDSADLSRDAGEIAGIGAIGLPITSDMRPTPDVLIDFTGPGVTYRPIRQMSGVAEFCEDFLDGVRAPLFNVIGGVNNGWRVAMTTLGHERGGRASVAHLGYEREFWELADTARKRGKAGRVDGTSDYAPEQSCSFLLPQRGRPQMGSVIPFRASA